MHSIIKHSIVSIIFKNFPRGHYAALQGITIQMPKCLFFVEQIQNK